MLWECSECGGQLRRRRPPRVGPNCGLAGAIFVPADSDDDAHLTASSLRDAWLRAGVEAVRSPGGPP